jgi:hypothetical protein
MGKPSQPSPFAASMPPDCFLSAGPVLPHSLVEGCQPILQKEAMSLDVALSLVNKLHSYLVHNIFAAAILPSEFAKSNTRPVG